MAKKKAATTRSSKGSKMKKTTDAKKRTGVKYQNNDSNGEFYVPF